jgi:hypothetical protein
MSSVREPLPFWPFAAGGALLLALGVYGLQVDSFALWTILCLTLGILIPVSYLVIDGFERLIELSERRWIQNVLSHRAAPEAPAGPLSAWAVPRAVLAEMALMALLFGYIFSTRDGDTFQQMLHLLFGAGGVGQLYVIGLHRSPQGARRIKYEVLFLSNFLLTFPMAVLSDRSGGPVLALAVIEPLVVALMGAVIVVRYRPNTPLMDGDPTSIRTIRAYRRVMMLGPGGIFAAFFLLRLLPFANHLYWMVRLVVKERMASRPVLFLRSFSHAGAADLLARVVVPAVAKHAVLWALVHERQTGAMLQMRLHDAWKCKTTVVPNEAWQRVIEDEMNRCLAVVIDCTTATAGLEWELAQARRLLPAAKIVALCPPGAAPPGVPYIEYDGSNPWRAQVTLDQWIDRMLKTEYGA